MTIFRLTVPFDTPTPAPVKSCAQVSYGLMHAFSHQLGIGTPLIGEATNALFSELVY